MSAQRKAREEDDGSAVDDDGRGRGKLSPSLSALCVAADDASGMESRDEFRDYLRLHREII
jgi:hypothetical protein